MFTGIISEIGKIESFLKTLNGAKVEIFAPKSVSQLKKGGSIAVDGICLTVNSLFSKSFTADLSPETLSVTTAKNFKKGNKVNLELPLKVGEPLGGHFVTGHVDGTGKIVKINKKGDYFKITFQTKPEILEFIVPKGSIAIDGISLTINEVEDESFSVVLIPETIKNTTLAGKKIGALVNIETDILLKGQLKKEKNKGKEKEINADFLKEAGFI